MTGWMRATTGVLAILVSASGVVADEAPPAVGQTATDFTLSTLGGSEVSLSS